MKAKSLKLRTLITLHALYKYSDENHRMNSKKLNEHLRPYDLCCTSRVLGDTIRVLRDYGINVQTKGEWEKYGIWIKDRPLSGKQFDDLVFAITTNPYISNATADSILKSLAPLVTVYQEPLLKSHVIKERKLYMNPSIYSKYMLICDAINSKRRVRYQTPHLKYDFDTQCVSMEKQWPTLFTPKCLYQSGEKLYMVGYNNTDKRTDAVDLSLITDLKIAFKHKDPKADQIEEILRAIVPEECIEKVTPSVIYKGPVTFRCRGQYLQDLYFKFGPPSEPVKKDPRGRTTYTVKEAEITEEFLYQLSCKYRKDIRIIGPDVLVEKIKETYTTTAEQMTDPLIRPKKKD